MFSPVRYPLSNTGVPLQLRVAASDAALAYVNAKAAMRSERRRINKMNDEGLISWDDRCEQVQAWIDVADEAERQLDCAISNLANAITPVEVK